MGTTSADLIPIVNSQVVVQGHTDPARLLSGELVYTGALRTPAEAVAPRVPLWGGSANVSADGFALIGDAHLWLGRLGPGGLYLPALQTAGPLLASSRGSAWLASVCADRDMLDDSALDAIARALADAQVRAVAAALEGILERWPVINTAVVAGLGDFIAVEAAETVGLDIVRLADRMGQLGPRPLPPPRLPGFSGIPWNRVDEATLGAAQRDQDRRRARGGTRRTGPRLPGGIGVRL